MRCLVLGFAFLLTAAQVVQCQEPDPCLTANHVEIDDYRRSTEYTIAHPEEPLCDDELPDGWYRFTSASGKTMPTTKIDRMRCGTVVPIWMNGDNPDVADGIVTRTACANLQRGGPQESNGCERTIDIRVKNCGTFYVYYLQATPGCPMAYCAGSREPCPAGQWSENDNFPPDCKDAYPKLTQPPRLSQPEIVGNAFRFDCQFEYTPHHPQQAFDVTWTFEGVDSHSEQVTDPDRTFSLDGSQLKGHLGKKLGCKVRAFFTNHPQQTKGPWLESNVYWPGIRPEQYHLNISEEDELRYVTLTSTLPLLCEDTKPGEDESCCVPIDLRVNGPNKVQAASSCSWPLCKSRWNDATKEARIPIPLSTSRDKITDSQGTDLLLKFHNLKPAPQHGSYLAVFDDYEISSVQIEVFDAEAKTCSLTGDPHILGLSGNRFNLYSVGDYTIYQNTLRYFEVQIRTWVCWGGKASCVCAVAVREYDDLIVVDGCNEAYYANGMASAEVTIFRKLRKGVSIKQATDGSQIGVYLPSGSEVLATGKNRGGPGYHYLDVYLKVPASDKGRGRGLCGTFDDNDSNEFTHRDGRVDGMCNGCEPEQFTKSWSNTHATSLFRTVPPLVYEPYVREFCQCDKDNQRADCTFQADPAYQCKPNCVEVNVQTNAIRRRRDAAVTTGVDVDETSDVYDPDDYKDFKPTAVTWAMPRNITEVEATRTCRESLETSAIWPHCNDKQKQEAESHIRNCIEDVKIGDTFDAVDSMIESFTTACQVELAKDPDNYQSNPETGKSVMKPEISTDICSTICDLHGRCVRGNCVCDQEFTGDNCQLPVNQPPILHRVRGSPLCDMVARPCEKIFIDAAYIQMKDTQACKVREVLVDGSVSTNISMEEAVFLTVSKLSCALPDTKGRSVTRFVVAVTVDGKVYSNELNVTVYDATCQNCTLEGCVKLPNTCLINDQCYRDRDYNPDNGTEVCDVATSTSRWTYSCGANCELHGSCDRGNCVCDDGYTGDNCQLPVPPVLYRVNGSSLCDIAAGPCRKIFIDAAYIQQKNTLACKVREVLPDGSVSTHVYVQDAVFLTDSELSCALPDPKGRSVTRFVVAVTVDGTVYSNELNLTVYDATCQNCTLEGCVKLPDTCLIDDQCYRDGDINQDNGKEVCDVATSTSQWTLPDQSQEPVSLTGPNDDNAMECAYHRTETDPPPRLEVYWTVKWNDYHYQWKRESLPAGTTTAFYDIDSLPRTGELTCTILATDPADDTSTGTFTDSNVVDLSTIPRR